MFVNANDRVRQMRHRSRGLRAPFESKNKLISFYEKDILYCYYYCVVYGLRCGTEQT